MKLMLKLFALFLCMVFLLLTTGCAQEKAAAPNENSGSNETQTTPTKENTSKSGSTDSKKTYANPPEMKIDVSKKYSAVISTSKGEFTIELFAKDAPITVNNFIFLSKEGYYNDVTFHRIIQSFMIQTGDPTGTGSGNPGYRFKDELSQTYKYEPGIVAMANSGPDTNGSQFFICTGESSKNLNNYPNYSIFGKIISGMETIKKIAETPVTANEAGETSSPTEKVVIQSIKIEEK